MQAYGLQAIESHQHDVLVFHIHNQGIDRTPLQFAPLLIIIVVTKHQHHQVRLILVEFWQVKRNIWACKLRLVEFVIEISVTSKMCGKDLGNFLYKLAVFTREGKSNPKSFSHRELWFEESLRHSYPVRPGSVK